jgi:glycosyltransferase involved in cell wall biosynthesis
MDYTATFRAAAGDPLISVIIPVRDDPEGIQKVLDCLAEQTLPPDQFEVNIGDDGSQPDLVPKIIETDGSVNLVKGPPQTSYAARNSAARLARGKILAFCDADCLPEPAWLEEGIAALRDADVVAGEVKFIAPARPTIWSLLTIDLFLDQNQNVRLSRGVTTNLLVRRKDFTEMRGFDQSLPSGGDYDFVKRMVESGAQLRYSPLSVVGHPTMDKAGPLVRKIFRTNLWSGVRRALARDKIELVGILALVPVLGVIIARYRALRPAFRLSSERLSMSSVAPPLHKRLLAVAAIYVVVFVAAGTGRILGWLKGTWRVKRNKGPVYATFSGQAATENPESKEITSK